MTDQAALSPEDAALAAEYAMGLLLGDEHAGFVARLRIEPVLWSEVQGWQEQLAMLADEIDVAPPARVKKALQVRLFGAGSTGALRFWQGLSFAGLASAAVLALLLLFQPVSAPTDVFAAEIVSSDDSLRLLAVVEGDTLHLTRTAGAAGDGRALELWLISGDDPPRSLGVLPDAATVRLTVPEAMRALIVGGTLALSDEPLGGSPTGLPTGDVLAVGAITTL